MNRFLQRSTLALATVAVLATGCANMNETQSNTAKGAGAGAAAGAAIGALTAGGHTGRSAVTGAAVGAGVGALGAYIWSNRMEQQRQSMQRATEGTGVAVTKTADNQLKLDIPSDISFETGRADIEPDFRRVLDQFATGLRQNPTATVRVIGHTDSTGSDAINDPLSLNRANSVRDYLIDRGANGANIATSGRGSHEPIASNTTEAGRARNRRVEIFMGEQQAAH
ncbi:OmpA family protein [Derxia gummosa]|uniref:OmpA family protein n=1 Tax=Derxia gummosa DSM 723 TaxID=1121388 RepID=A0A8B6X0T1_9BURK|nr:OmpA family protein [Derxia gummosa]